MDECPSVVLLELGQTIVEVRMARAKPVELPPLTVHP